MFSDVKRVVGDHDQLFADQAMKGGEGGDEGAGSEGSGDGGGEGGDKSHTYDSDAARHVLAAALCSQRASSPLPRVM